MTNEQGKKVAEQHRQMREGVADAILAWASLENGSVMLLANLISDREDLHFASAIYFAPTSIDVRTSILNRAFLARFNDELQHRDFRELWGKLVKRIDGKRQKRNIIAHSGIATHFQNDENHVRLMKPIWNSYELVPLSKSGQLPGMSANDVLQISKGIWDLAETLQMFTSAVRSFRIGGAQALSQACLQLKTRFSTE